MRRTLLSATVPLLKAVSGMCVTFTALLNDRPLENTKNEGQLGKSKSHSRVVLKSSTKQKTTVFSTRASEKSSSDCKKGFGTHLSKGMLPDVSEEASRQFADALWALIVFLHSTFCSCRCWDALRKTCLGFLTPHRAVPGMEPRTPCPAEMC
ncbi:uncharacterized protein LOC118923037 isoform X1 [Manis pentadactyla]|uniref:uncharacterized protein LOC118923037 isoform X1 n=1 Tax=Manis pentadactyla TaxID=143292 RepID=UPI00255C5F66|nr:uncharacterized protein LOC118923037 isoform X1 [Manis pentadactyla]